MENLFCESNLVKIWLLLPLLCPLGFAFLLWRAMRTGQFSSPARSAILPLTNCMPEEDDNAPQAETQAGVGP